MTLLYRAVKTIASIARYPLSWTPVIAIQRSMLDADPEFRRRWGERGRWASARISPRDAMYLGRLRHYYGVGLSGIECIEEAIDTAGVSTPRNVLDLPSGHGRVLRFLVERFPDARFTACDLDHDAVNFCAMTFGARAVVSRPDVDALMLDERFDLIWCGSLLTHLDEPQIEALLRFFRRHLDRAGLLVFSVHGDRAADMLRRGKLFSYGLERNDADRVLRSYTYSGFGYADYDARRAPGYGVAFSAPAWVHATLARVGGLREVYFAKSRWAGHHDVYGVVQV